MYQQTINKLEAKVAKVRRRSIKRIVFGRLALERIALRCGIGLGILTGFYLMATLPMPDGEKQPLVWSYIVVSLVIGPSLLLGVLFYVAALIFRFFVRVIDFFINGVATRVTTVRVPETIRPNE